MLRPLLDDDLRQAKARIVAHHYTHSVPSGKSYYFRWSDAVVCFAIPANKNISRWLVAEDNRVWELARLWAPNDHEPNLLTQAVSRATEALRLLEPTTTALVSYADPNVGHSGGVYRAASWVYLGQCEETRAYRGAAGEIVSRRAFHSGSRSLRKAEIEALGYVQLKLPGKHRFAKGLSKKARKRITERVRNA